MKDLTELFWNSSLDELKNGYVFDQTEEQFICLICGKKYHDGQVYHMKDSLYEARKAIAVHIKEEHDSVFTFLLSMDKQYTSLTDHQRELLKLFYQGLSDKEIALQSGSSASTVRNHRFNFREKEKQARIFLAIAELLKEGVKTKKNGTGSSLDQFVDFPRSAKMVDERFAFTREEYENTLKKYFTEGPDGNLSEYPLKEKRRVIILTKIIERFERGKTYTEKEVNEILKTVYPDYAILRRHLVEYGFLDRIPDGSTYWVLT
ncbi:MAG: DUF2087 domain-containing protein [Peptococcaceae bacterium]|nr:DUF2087 domain-containing protein [Peptococcaceae bacterium]